MSVGIKGIKFKGLGGRWIIPLLLVASLAAASDDLRLVDAVRKGDREAVRSLLEQHADVNMPQSDGATALMWAAHWGDLETTELLIRAGANVNTTNEHGATALWLACTNGDVAMIDRLLKAGADPNVALRSGETPLMAAAGTNIDAVKPLLAHGTGVNAKELQGGQTALMWAIAKRRPEIAGVLIEHGADVNARSESGFTPLMFAAQQGDMDSAQMLLAAGADVNEATSEGMTALLVAAASGWERLVAFMLDKGANPNAADRDGYTALHHASSQNMLESVKALLAHGANPNARLVKDPAEGNDDTSSIFAGATPFFLAAAVRDVSVVRVSVLRVLAASGADPNLATTETVFLPGTGGRRLQMVANTTPLMMAAGGGRYLGNYPPITEEEEKVALEALKLLVELGCDINAVNAYGQTALHGAAYIGANKVIQFLLDNGAKVDILDMYEQTPLSIAQRVHTVALEDDLDMQPRTVYESTANLLLKSGATPLADLGVQVLEEIR